MSDHEQWGKGTQAKIICDSINYCGNRLTTFVLKYPRFVHAELMTHRLFSRNSSSSRAIPTKKLIQRVVDDPAMPVYWGRNQSGMQARRALEGDELDTAEEIWLDARNKAVEMANELLELGVHKQLVNRLIETWMHITVIVTATNYVNWFKLRDHEDAQPEIAHLARMMRDAYDEQKPTPLQPGEWHLPFIDQEVDMAWLQEYADVADPERILRWLSIARCARVSYLTHEGDRDPGRDIDLYHRLCKSDPPHASAFEHTAMALASPEPIGNFRGWLQYRKLVPNEAVHG